MTTAVDYEKYQGQKVIVQVKLDTPNEKGETLIELEGKAEAANALGILIKPKGRTQVELIEARKIESVEFAPEVAKKISAKTVKVVDFGNARQHCADRHGVQLTEINNMTEQDVYEWHAALDHDGLGHVHGEKTKERAEAVAAAEADAGTGNDNE